MKKNVKDALAKQRLRKAEIRDGVLDAHGHSLSPSGTGPPRSSVGRVAGLARETSKGVAMADLGGRQDLAGSWA